MIQMAHSTKKWGQVPSIYAVLSLLTLKMADRLQASFWYFQAFRIPPCCVISFSFFLPLWLLKALFPSSQFVSVKYHSDTIIQAMNSSTLALWALSYEDLKPHVLALVQSYSLDRVLSLAASRQRICPLSSPVSYWLKCSQNNVGKVEKQCWKCCSALLLCNDLLMV